MNADVVAVQGHQQRQAGGMGAGPDLDRIRAEVSMYQLYAQGLQGADGRAIGCPATFTQALGESRKHIAADWQHQLLESIQGQSIGRFLSADQYRSPMTERFRLQPDERFGEG